MIDTERLAGVCHRQCILTPSTYSGSVMGTHCGGRDGLVFLNRILTVNQGGKRISRYRSYMAAMSKTLTHYIMTRRSHECFRPLWIVRGQIKLGGLWTLGHTKEAGLSTLVGYLSGYVRNVGIVCRSSSTQDWCRTGFSDLSPILLRTTAFRRWPPGPRVVDRTDDESQTWSSRGSKSEHSQSVNEGRTQSRSISGMRDVVMKSRPRH